MERKCEICSKVFYRKLSHVKMGWGRFCSRTCQYLSMKSGKIVSCDECKKQVYRSNTSLERPKSGKFFCTKSCQTKWRNKYFSGKKHPGWIGGEGSYRNILIHRGIKQVCKRCRKDDKRVLAVHHMDRNRKNNGVRNLIWLCHNCHFVVHHDKVEGQGFLK